MKDKILIVGTGAIGGFYGALLAKAGADVSVVCRSDYPIVIKKGYQIRSRQLGQWKFSPTQIIRHSRDYQGPANYVILCSKITPDVNRVELIREAISSDTVIVLIQNGIEVEQELAAAFPDNQLVSGLAFICCNRIQPGVIDHIAYGKLSLGNFPCGISRKTSHLRELFKHSGIECVTMDDIVQGRWIKCVWNAPFNPLSVLSGGLSTTVILNDQEPFIRHIMQEVCDIAAACGHPLPKNIIDNNIRNTYQMPPYKTSMLLDYEHGRPMETEAILGNTLRAARRSGIETPLLDAVYALMQLRTLQIAHGIGRSH